MKKENLLSKAEMKKILGGRMSVESEPNCYDQCIAGSGVLEGFCTDGSLCIEVPMAGCDNSPRKCVYLV